MTTILSFPNLLKEIRKEAGLNQDKFAEILGVSSVLIAMVETGKREPSKNIIDKLSEKMGVKSFSLMPFLSTDEIDNIDELSFIEKKMYEFGSSLQEDLIKKKSKLLVL